MAKQKTHGQRSRVVRYMTLVLFSLISSLFPSSHGYMTDFSLHVLILEDSFPVFLVLASFYCNTLSHFFFEQQVNIKDN